ncbi:DUF1428 domain-containing protein [Halioxenophilus sp. WMMB6]|uniref:DUF1428 domain-containing protein n=1 Tax=Halioxenophilus sp. WMMB6 TaxID=3073815 RepID=UPI00295F1371|nr:DUF1428 domain-containing protein [Halioxenophilus sp. WMMB6]
MPYIDGFIIAVPHSNKERFISHASSCDSIFIDFGATRVIECWQDDLPSGEVSDFRQAVQAKGDEAVVFSWVEWPDKATRDTAMAKMLDPSNSDPRMDPNQNPMPFDGMRMIFGGFTPVVQLSHP